jgi:hypothetical protein
VDVGDGGERRLSIEAVITVLADPLIFDQQIAVHRLGSVPAAAVRFGDADSESEWMGFLSHELPFEPGYA